MTSQTATEFKNAPGLKDCVRWALGGEPNGTHLQGEIECSYADLVSVFGPPNHEGDGYKIDAEWILTFSHFDGLRQSVATIYNYKDGKNYLGAEEGRAVADIIHWHIGGKESEVVGFVSSMIIAHLRASEPAA